MGIVITDDQRGKMQDGGASSIPDTLGAILKANHARVLDFFRQMDSNFDGCISEGEMGYALNALGLNASPKELKALFRALDPDGNGVVEFGELQRALKQGIQASDLPPPRPLTAAQRIRKRMEDKEASYTMCEMIYDFERQRGLEDPMAKPPPNAAVAMGHERMAQLQETVRLQRQAQTNPIDRGKLMSSMDSVWLKSPLIRPQTAPARVSQAASAARRKAAVYDFWLNKHRAEIESHSRAVEMEYLEEKRMRRERVANRRNDLRATLHTKQQASRIGAIERQEPFMMKKEMASHKHALLSRQRTRAWSQDIVFLPPTVAKREQSLQKERAEADYIDGINSVLSLK